MCRNYRAISLLSVLGKLYPKVLQQRLKRYVEEAMSEDQVGFRKERGTNIRDHAAIREIYRTKQDIVQQLHRLRTDVSPCAAGRIVESNEIVGVTEELLMLEEDLTVNP